MDLGVFLGVPTESVAVRLVIASAVAVLLARLLLQSGLRLARVRAAAALVPTFALIAVVVLQWDGLRLPVLMMPVDAVGGLALPVGRDYVNVAPLAAPLLVGIWAMVAGCRIFWRWRGMRSMRARAADEFDLRSTSSPEVRAIVQRVAERMRVTPPPVAVTPSCPGGATVVGIRRPLVLVDEQLANSLDELELEGVLAHELAHIKRRDNLVAALLGFVRDAAFFVPGGRWALRQLHAERELAADQLAVGTTGRPGALASGLLKVIDEAIPSETCAALKPRGTLVDRVQHLVEEPEPVGTGRSVAEVGLVAGVVAISVLGAVGLPTLVADGGERDALAVLWQNAVEEAPAASEEQVEARAFQVYRDSQLETPSTRTVSPLIDDDPVEMRRSTLEACAAGAGCRDREQRPGLPLQPRPRGQVDDDLLARWRWEATPLVESEEWGGLYWLSRNVEAATGPGTDW